MSETYSTNPTVEYKPIISSLRKLENYFSDREFAGGVAAKVLFLNAGNYKTEHTKKSVNAIRAEFSNYSLLLSDSVKKMTLETWDGFENELNINVQKNLDQLLISGKDHRTIDSDSIIIQPLLNFLSAGKDYENKFMTIGEKIYSIRSPEYTSNAMVLVHEGTDLGQENKKLNAVQKIIFREAKALIEQVESLKNMGE